jgi:hypothetical protein
MVRVSTIYYDLHYMREYTRAIDRIDRFEEAIYSPLVNGSSCVYNRRLSHEQDLVAPFHTDVCNPEPSKSFEDL